MVTGLLGGGPFTYDGRFHRAHDAVNLPPALQQPRPRVFVGGKGDRLLRLVAERADGWNTCWTWTPDAYRERLAVLDAACDAVGRDPATIWRTLGLYALVGEDERDLERRFEQLRTSSPRGVLDGVDLETYRSGRLVGTVEAVREQVAAWEALGVETLILGAGVVPVPGQRARRRRHARRRVPLIRDPAATLVTQQVDERSAHVRSRSSGTHHHPADRADHLRRIEAPQLARSLGSAQKEFKDGLAEGEKADGSGSTEKKTGEGEAK